MPNPPPFITLLTDFGEADSYVGVMKGVMLRIVPTAQLIDISHRIAPQNIRQAAWLLSNVYAYYPSHTVHLVVIDPGVGGPRRALAVETDQGRFVAPDNGVLSTVWQRESSSRAVYLENPDYRLPSPSHTFHGRDVFSPAAAHLAAGVPLDELGPAVDEIVMLDIPTLTIKDTRIEGTVRHIDHFGNILTDIATLQWISDTQVEFRPETDPDASPLVLDASALTVACGWHQLRGLKQTYSQVPVGKMLALVGSSGELEISINQGHAAEGLSINVGDPVTLYFNR